MAGPVDVKLFNKWSFEDIEVSSGLGRVRMPGAALVAPASSSRLAIIIWRLDVFC